MKRQNTFSGHSWKGPATHSLALQQVFKFSPAPDLGGHFTDAHGREEPGPDRKSERGLQAPRRQPPAPPHTHPGQLLPLLFVLHLLLHLVDALQGLQTLVQQERRVIDQHVYVANELLSRTEKATWSRVSPQQDATADPREEGRACRPTGLLTLAQLEYPVKVKSLLRVCCPF